MDIHFSDIFGRSLTSYKTYRPLVPIILDIEFDSPAQAIEGTITINNETYVSVSRAAYSTIQWTFSSNRDNFYYAITDTETPTTLNIVCNIKVTNEDNSTENKTCSFTAEYLHPRDSVSIDGLCGSFYLQKKNEGNENIPVLPQVRTPGIYEKPSDTNDITGVERLSFLLAGLSGCLTIDEYNVPQYERLSQYAQEVIRKYKLPTNENNGISVSDKIYYIADNPLVATTISKDSILRDAIPNASSFTIDSIVEKTNCNVSTIVSGGIVIGLSVTLSETLDNNSYCGCIVKLTNTNSDKPLYISLWFDPKPTPSINAVDDVFQVTQGSSTTILYSALMANDFGTNISFSRVIPNSAINGTAVADNTNKLVTFTSTGLTGEPAGFQYEISSTDGYKSIGNVNMVINRLPDVDVYIFNEEQAEQFMKDFTPPTLADVFNSWTRISNGYNYYPPGTTPAGEAASWEMISANQFRCTVNSSYLTGFVSPDVYDNYTHEATFSSTAADDDGIALIMAYKRDGTTNRILIVERNGGGIYNTTYRFSIRHYTNTANNTDTQVEIMVPSANVVANSKGNWSAIGSTRVYVQRSGNIFTVKASPFKSTAYADGSLMTLDLTQYPTLSWAMEPCSYGYACFSQQYSSFTDVVFDGGLKVDIIVDIDNNKVYRYSNSTWTATNETVQDIYGYPRTITNPETGKKYEIQKDTIIALN